jgi:hypothetical protein
MRVILQFGETWFVELAPGASVVGRDPASAVQLHDDAVSRRHARFQWDGSGRVTVLDLGSTNGTRVNGAYLEATREVADGDVILIGHSLCTVRLLHHDDGAGHQPVGVQRNRAPSCQPHLPATETLATCTTCLQPLPTDGSECPTCAGERQAERRRDHRVQAQVPVRFSCGGESFTSTLHDLSLGGLFLVTRRTAQPGPCAVTLLPDDTGPMVVKGQVRHVIRSATSDGHPPGIGIKFTAVERRAWRWIQGVVARHEEPWVYGDTSNS